eukprot:TRINITY_DN11676_c0_g1_i1.p1 TRINITY_DN11676_c0_g1~~TRINITY_DN11676_c0_g1_i1.p1  ORF type:complete len:252 (-),score=47.82 TRINITY_DN11676_c0_g1_i1:8-763(-)
MNNLAFLPKTAVERVSVPNELEPQTPFHERSHSVEGINYEHGTTTLSFVYDGGVIIAVDSRATQGPSIATQTVLKYIPITDNIVTTMAGGAADCQFWFDVVAEECRVTELRERRPISVPAASRILADIVYQYRGYGLSIGAMVAGVDENGFHLNYVDNDGTTTKGDRFSVGSGSTFAYSVMETHYRADMCDQEAYDLARNSVAGAGHRDAMSGGIITVIHINKDGWKLVDRTRIDDVKNFQQLQQDSIKNL